MVLLVCYLKTFLAGQISPFILFYIISVWPSLQWPIMKTRFSKLMRKIKLVKFIANLRSRGKEEEKSVLDRLIFWEVEKTKFNETKKGIPFLANFEFWDKLTIQILFSSQFRVRPYGKWYNSFILPFSV